MPQDNPFDKYKKKPAQAAQAAQNPFDQYKVGAQPDTVRIGPEGIRSDDPEAIQRYLREAEQASLRATPSGKPVVDMTPAPERPWWRRRARERSRERARTGQPLTTLEEYASIPGDVLTGFGEFAKHSVETAAKGYRSIYDLLRDDVARLQETEEQGEQFARDLAMFPIDAARHTREVTQRALAGEDVGPRELGGAWAGGAMGLLGAVGAGQYGLKKFQQGKRFVRQALAPRPPLQTPSAATITPEVQAQLAAQARAAQARPPSRPTDVPYELDFIPPPEGTLPVEPTVQAVKRARARKGKRAAAAPQQPPPPGEPGEPTPPTQPAAPKAPINPLSDISDRITAHQEAIKALEAERAALPRPDPSKLSEHEIGNELSELSLVKNKTPAQKARIAVLEKWVKENIESKLPEPPSAPESAPELMYHSKRRAAEAGAFVSKNTIPGEEPWRLTIFDVNPNGTPGQPRGHTSYASEQAAHEAASALGYSLKSKGLTAEPAPTAPPKPAEPTIEERIAEQAMGRPKPDPLKMTDEEILSSTSERYWREEGPDAPKAPEGHFYNVEGELVPEAELVPAAQAERVRRIQRDVIPDIVARIDRANGWDQAWKVRSAFWDRMYHLIRDKKLTLDQVSELFNKGPVEEAMTRAHKRSSDRWQEAYEDPRIKRLHHNEELRGREILPPTEPPPMTAAELPSLETLRGRKSPGVGEDLATDVRKLRRQAARARKRGDVSAAEAAEAAAKAREKAIELEKEGFIGTGPETITPEDLARTQIIGAPQEPGKVAGVILPPDKVSEHARMLREEFTEKMNKVRAEQGLPPMEPYEPPPRFPGESMQDYAARVRKETAREPSESRVAGEIRPTGPAPQGPRHGTDVEEAIGIIREGLRPGSSVSMPGGRDYEGYSVTLEFEGVRGARSYADESMLGPTMHEGASKVRGAKRVKRVFLDVGDFLTREDAQAAYSKLRQALDENGYKDVPIEAARWVDEMPGTGEEGFEYGGEVAFEGKRSFREYVQRLADNYENAPREEPRSGGGLTRKELARRQLWDEASERMDALSDETLPAEQVTKLQGELDVVWKEMERLGIVEPEAPVKPAPTKEPPPIARIQRDIDRYTGGPPEPPSARELERAYLEEDVRTPGTRPGKMPPLPEKPAPAVERADLSALDARIAAERAEQARLQAAEEALPGPRYESSAERARRMRGEEAAARKKLPPKKVYENELRSLRATLRNAERELQRYPESDKREFAETRRNQALQLILAAKERIAEVEALKAGTPYKGKRDLKQSSAQDMPLGPDKPPGGGGLGGEGGFLRLRRSKPKKEPAPLGTGGYRPPPGTLQRSVLDDKSLYHTVEDVRKIASGQGTVTVYHGTIKEFAESLLRSGRARLQAYEQTVRDFAKLYNIPYTELNRHIVPYDDAKVIRLSTAPAPVASRWGTHFRAGEVNDIVNSTARMLKAAKRLGISLEEATDLAAKRAKKYGKQATLTNDPDFLYEPDLFTSGKEGALVAFDVDVRALPELIRREAGITLKEISEGEPNALEFWNHTYKDMKIDPRHLRNPRIVKRGDLDPKAAAQQLGLRGEGGFAFNPFAKKPSPPLSPAEARVDKQIARGQLASRTPLMDKLWHWPISKFFETAHVGRVLTRRVERSGRTVPLTQKTGYWTKAALDSPKRFAGALRERGPGYFDDAGKWQDMGVGSLTDALKPIRGNAAELAKVERLLVAQHNEAMLAAGRETGISPADAAEIIRTASPRNLLIAAKVRAWLNAFGEAAVESGALSRELWEQLREKYPWYIPAERAFEGEGAVPRGGYYERGRPRPGVKPPLRRAKQGSENPIVSPFETIPDYGRRMMRYTDTHRALRSMLDLVDANRDVLGDLAVRVGSKPLPRSGAQAVLGELLSDRALRLEGDQIRIYNARTNAIETWKMEPLVADFMNGLAAKEWGLISEILGTSKKGLQAGVTTYNPFFWLTNFIRDNLGRPTVSEATSIPFQRPLRRMDIPRYRTMGGGYGVSQESQGFVERLRGAMPGRGRLRATQRERARTARSITGTDAAPVRVLNSFDDWIKDAGAAFEELTRGAEYEAQKSMGLSDLEAYIHSQERLGNFGEHGTAGWVRTLDHITPFMNPAKQGLRSFLEASTAKGRRGKTALKGITTITLPTLALYALNYDDQEIQDQRLAPGGYNSHFLRDPRYYLRVRGGIGPPEWADIKTIFRMPKPFLPGGIYGTNIEHALDAARGIDEHALRRTLSDVGNELWQGSMNPLISVPVSLGRNKALGTGVPIVPAEQKDFVSEEQVGTHPNYSLQALSRALPKPLRFSPAKAHYTLGQFFGTAGRETPNVLDILTQSDRLPESRGFADVPGVSRFFARSPSSSAAPIRDVYDDARRGVQIMETLEGLTANGDAEGVARLVREHGSELGTAMRDRIFTRQLSQLSDYAEFFANSENLSPRERREGRDRLLRQMTELARTFHEQMHAPQR